ncbi:MAG: hypothetical protein LBV77_03675 [Candidatus Adiutrix intracellularis]|nr:hypothetical protein [Candidatus Adiutrix intracellularis]
MIIFITIILDGSGNQKIILLGVFLVGGLSEFFWGLQRTWLLFFDAALVVLMIF